MVKIVKWITAVLAVAGFSHSMTTPSSITSSKTPSPTLVPSQQAPTQVARPDGDGKPFPRSPTPPCCS